MAADFFQQQDIARRNTTRLVILFALAVLAIVISVDLLLAVTLGVASRDSDTGAINWTAAADPQLLLLSAVATLAVVGGGSLYKTAQLRGGGHVVAEALGGRPLTTDTADPAERRVLNVVEEMAIASGTPVPPVYLLDQEAGINAFAAGFTPEDAVIGVTRGTVTQLSRDELQGVIAHEFSHILNGDMRLNIRLMGLLHGILIIGIIGYFILRSSLYAGMAGRRRSRDGNGAFAIAALGIGLAVVGFAGTFFGNLIKAAVSRQREFLADASAVQFTRQPDGIAGALRKIGGVVSGSSIQHPSAPEASHLFFGRATGGLAGLFSTHPPLDERIRRIDPSWDGTFPEVGDHIEAPAAEAPAMAGASGFAAGGSGQVADIVGAIGQPGAAHLRYAAQLIAQLPRPLVDAAHEPYGARAVIYGLLLDRRSPDARRTQLAHLQAAADRGVFEETLRLAPLVAALDATLRLPLVEIALPALGALTPAQHDLFKANVVVLVEADQAIDLFEWSLHRILLRDLERRQGRMPAPRVKHRSADVLLSECELLISVLAYVGHRDAGAVQQAFERGRDRLRLPQVRLRRQEECSLPALDAALSRLDEAAPEVKRRVLQGAGACVTADRQVTATEAELLRAVSASMSCPMPPLLETAGS
jgi:Zn-dependent protease with chaperone function